MIHRNKKRKVKSNTKAKANLLKYDPTQTGNLRAEMERHLSKMFAKIKASVRKYLIIDDKLGLKNQVTNSGGGTGGARDSTENAFVPAPSAPFLSFNEEYEGGPSYWQDETGTQYVANSSDYFSRCERDDEYRKEKEARAKEGTTNKESGTATGSESGGRRDSGQHLGQDCRIGIIGGGPGGLITAYLLRQRLPACYITIYEASDRLGGKVRTQSFPQEPALTFEGGVAELYKAPPGKPDPLFDLIEELGLKHFPIQGEAVVLGDTIVKDEEDLDTHYGGDAQADLKKFYKQTRDSISPEEYHDRKYTIPKDHPMLDKTYADALEPLNEDTRKYIEAYTHSDVAVHPTRTTAMYGMMNLLTNDPDYLTIYTLNGGIEELTKALAKKLNDDQNVCISLNNKVTDVVKGGSGYLVRHAIGGNYYDVYDKLICCLPAGWIGSVDWDGDLDLKVREYTKRYDNLANYLRVTLLFSRPFWQDKIDGHWWMSDSFDGTCVYCESERLRGCGVGILGWLIAGDAAQVMSNYDKDRLAQECLNSLPTFMQQDAKQCYMDVRVNRYIGEVSGLPGSAEPIKGPDIWCDKTNHLNLMFVGDYQYDGTLNGVWESADDAVKAIANEPTTNYNPNHDEKGRFATAVGHAIETLKGYEHKIKDVISGNFAKLPKPVQKAVKVGIKGAFATWAAGQEFATRVAHERGLTDLQVAKLKTALIAADLISFKPISLGMGFMADPITTGIASLIPPATAAYLLHSTAKNPIATLKAAMGVVKDTAKRMYKAIPVSKAPPVSAWPWVHNVEHNAADSVAKALADHSYDDWYCALLHAAIGDTRFLPAAIEVANKAYKGSVQAHKFTYTPNGDNNGNGFAANTLRYDGTTNSSNYFSECPRDEHGWCKADGSSSKIYVKDDPSRYGKKSYDLTAPNGSPVRGIPISPKDPRIPEEVFHMTSNLPAVRSSGYLKAAGEGGLGGDKMDQIVSVTIDRSIAYQLAKDTEWAATVVQKHGAPPKREWNDKESRWEGDRTEWAKSVMKDLEQKAKEDRWDGYRPVDIQLESYDIGDHLRQYFSLREGKTEIKDPQFWDVEKTLSKIDPTKVGVVKIPKGALNTGAMLTDFDLDNPVGLKEIRIYGDVPLIKKSTVANLVVQNYDFPSSREQLDKFQSWLKMQLRAEILNLSEEQLWKKYTLDAMKKGAGRAFASMKKQEAAEAFGDTMKTAGLKGSEKEFLKEAFSQPVATEKLQLLASRSFSDLENITVDMSDRMGRVLTDGLAKGQSPKDIATMLDNEVDIGGRRAYKIARTEVIRAHAQGTLMGLKKMGVSKVGVEVEFNATGGDEGFNFGVCEQCMDYQGQVFPIEEADNIIPVHPLCRCAWLPVIPEPDNTVNSSFTKLVRDSRTVQNIGACKLKKIDELIFSKLSRLTQPKIT